MHRYSKPRSQKKGLAPGTLVHIGEKKSEEIKLSLIHYNKTNLKEIELKSVKECAQFINKPGVLWINLDGLHRTETIEQLGQLFKLHPLVLEDIVNTEQRPKLEEYDDYLYIVLKMIYSAPQNSTVVTEQLSLILGKNYVLTFQEKPGDIFDLLRERIRANKGRIRKAGADYLAYSLIDAIIDSYFGIMEKGGEELENLEDEVVSSPSTKTLNRIHHLKRDMIFLRKAIWPLREVIGRLQNIGKPFIQPPTIVYLRDIYDHSIQLMDTVETFRDMLSGMLDIYLSSINNRLNEIMKVLTIIATIFMPLTFITGLYGMNFKFMPELYQAWGYPAVLTVMVFVVAVMLAYFRRKKWI
ncbi:MAG: magnesium/cobalt transporter CorA [bacterium]